MHNTYVTDDDPTRTRTPRNCNHWGGAPPTGHPRLTAIDPSSPTQHPSASCRLLPRLLALLLLLLLLPAMVVPESANGLVLMCCVLKAPPSASFSCVMAYQ